MIISKGIINLSQTWLIGRVEPTAYSLINQMNGFSPGELCAQGGIFFKLTIPPESIAEGIRGSVSTLGIDLAKNSFELHGVDERGRVVLSLFNRHQR